MASTSLIFIGSQFCIYSGFIILKLGLIGNLINLFVLFSTRTNPCSFLLWLASIFNIITLLAGLLPRILSIGFSVDASSTSLMWCKSRWFLSYTSAFTSLTCICFASIDRYLVSSQYIQWHHRSKLKTAKLAIVIATSVIMLIHIPFIAFYHIIQVNNSNGNVIYQQCFGTNTAWNSYVNYFTRPMLGSIMPGTVLAVTGWRTYLNIKLRMLVHPGGTFQRGLTTMILLQSILIIIPVVPFSIIIIYQIATTSTSKTAYRLAQETVVFNIANIFLYISYASNFYVYFFSAKSYRKELFRLVSYFVCYRSHRVEIRRM
ncbi:unnamed protein product [Adineta ricciae]|uniref:G-protein coupled receptors family 1 profile domain-containing protein n=1 Tax=Adineta ricciae TaxID=249248 RepID=A0A814IB64_ADIRI|nr:unnamed protein product [Adineta ricciae]CAF1165846.1 unnamed protein product [Adineta ricciae]